MKNCRKYAIGLLIVLVLVTTTVSVMNEQDITIVDKNSDA